MPALDPFRLRVLKALTAALEEIRPAAGYRNDLHKSVFRGRLVYGDGDPLPMLSILEPPQPIDQIAQGGGNISGDWDLLIQGFVKDDPKNPTDPAYVLMADVMKRLGAEQDRRLDGRTLDVLGMGGGRGKGNEIMEMTIGHGIARPADDISAKAYFWLTLTLRTAEDLKDPFA